MSLLQSLAPYRVTAVRVPKATSNGLWRTLIARVGPDYSDRPIAFWGLASPSVG